MILVYDPWVWARYTAPSYHIVCCANRRCIESKIKYCKSTNTAAASLEHKSIRQNLKFSRPHIWKAFAWSFPVWVVLLCNADGLIWKSHHTHIMNADFSSNYVNFNLMNVFRTYVTWAKKKIKIIMILSEMKLGSTNACDCCGGNGMKSFQELTLINFIKCEWME